MRNAEVHRKTRETEIDINLVLDGKGETSIETGIPFFDHMLDILARHAGFDLTLKAKGDLQVDAHHTVEDVGICLGQALREALGDKRGIKRFGWAIVPMDEALAISAIDISGRPHMALDAEFPLEALGVFDPALVKEFLHAFTNHAALTVHLRILSGGNLHHMIESLFKSLAKSLESAVSKHERLLEDVPSTKGTIE